MIGHSFPTLEEKPYIPTMLKNRIFPILALLALVPLWAWAQAPAPVPTPVKPAAPGAGGDRRARARPASRRRPGRSLPLEPPTEAEKVLDEAMKKLAALKSVSADVVQTVVMLSQKFSVQGRYLRAPENKMYLKLQVTGLGDAVGVMQQVCDGQTLWDYQHVLEAQEFRKIGKIPAILEKLNSPDLDAKVREVIVTQYLRLSGPESLLTGLRKTIKFTQKEDATLDGKPVWLIHGEWQNREALNVPDQRPLPPNAPLPAYIPSLVSVWIGKEDGWPYKIRLQGRKATSLEDTRQIGPDGRRIGTLDSAKRVQRAEPSEVLLVYSNVKLNPTLEGKEFFFQAPATAQVKDETEAILNGLDQALQAQAAKKKAEAADGKVPAEDALLKQSLDVPRQPETPK